MSPLFENAIDSLKTGMEFFRDKKEKYAVLLIFHSIELLLKELLSRRNPILIYRNIDKLITDDSQTVGLTEALIRFKNLKIHLTKDEEETLKSLQRRRNQIEHHRYDLHHGDRDTVGQSLRFIKKFVYSYLKDDLSKYIDEPLLVEIDSIILTYSEKIGIAEHNLEEWIDTTYENGNRSEDFVGTVDCPECRQTYLILDGPNIGNYCFFCRKKVDAVECDNCYRTFMPNHEGEKTCEYCTPATDDNAEAEATATSGPA